VWRAETGRTGSDDAVRGVPSMGKLASADAVRGVPSVDKLASADVAFFCFFCVESVVACVFRRLGTFHPTVCTTVLVFLLFPLPAVMISKQGSSPWTNRC